MSWLGERFMLLLLGGCLVIVAFAMKLDMLLPAYVFIPTFFVGMGVCYWALFEIMTKAREIWK